MKFRDMEIDDVVVIGPFDKETFVKKLKELHQEYTVIDLQYAMAVIPRYNHRYSALALVQKINKNEEPHIPRW